MAGGGDKKTYQKDGKTYTWYHERWQRREHLPDEYKPSLEPVKEKLRKLLGDRHFTDLLRAKDEQRSSRDCSQGLLTLTQSELNDFIPDIASEAGYRLFTMLNYGFDPELIGPVLVQFREESPLSKKLVSFLASDQGAKERIEAILLKDAQIYHIESTEKREIHEEEIEAFKEELANYCEGKAGLSEGQSATELSTFYEATFSGLDNFIADVKRSTATSYFQRGYICDYAQKKNDSHPGLSPLKYQNEIWERSEPFPQYSSLTVPLLDYARAVEQTDYPIWLLNAGKKLYQHLFPEAFEDLPIKVKYKSIFDDEKTARNFSYFSEENNAFFSAEDEIDVIGIVSVYPPSEELKEALKEMVPDIRSKNKMVTRKSSDLLSFIHEYSHLLFTHRQRLHTPDISKKRKKLKENENWDYRKTADHAFNEGFAVMMELIAEYKIRQRPQNFGFREEELENLAVQKQSRFASFRKRDESGERKTNGYSEGTMGVMHKVYKQALKKRGDVAIPDGVQAMLNLVESLDPDKTYNTKRTDPEYLQTLENPEVIEYFVRK